MPARALLVVACAALLLALLPVGLARAPQEHTTTQQHVRQPPLPVVDDDSLLVSECSLPAGFVHLSDVDATIVQEMRYAAFHNFVGRPIANYTAPRCILTLQAAQALATVQSFLQSGAADPVRGQRYSLKMYDCYRPTSAVADFVRWAQNLDDDKMKAEFYPEVDKSQLFAAGYIAFHSGHSRGSTMDLTLVPLPPAAQPVFTPGVTPLVSCHAPWGTRWQDNSLDMGTGFDCFSTISWTNDTAGTGVTQQFNRLMLQQAMQQVGGFINYDEEWWHYTLIDQPFPDTEFDFPVC